MRAVPLISTPCSNFCAGYGHVKLRYVLCVQHSCFLLTHFFTFSKKVSTGRQSSEPHPCESDLHVLVGPHTFLRARLSPRISWPGTVVGQLKKGILTGIVWLVNHHLHFLARFYCDAASLDGLVQAWTSLDDWSKLGPIAECRD